MLRILLSILGFAVFAGSVGLKAKASAEVYLRKEAPSIRTYVSDYAASKDWNIRCTRQTSGRTLGEPRCDLEPWQGSVYPRTGIRKGVSKGLAIETSKTKKEREVHTGQGRPWNQLRGKVQFF